MADILTVALPLLLLVAAVVGAAYFEQKVPTRLRLYRFHVLMYLTVAVLSLILGGLMESWVALDLWVDDATVYLESLFGISGTALCLLLAPVVWWLERHSDRTRGWKVGQGVVTLATLLPYLLIVGILLFYRE